MVVHDTAGKPIGNGDEIQKLDEAIRQHPKDAKLYARRAVLRRDRDEWELAMVDLDSAIELNPLHSEALSLRAALYIGDGDHDERIEDCTAVTRHCRVRWFHHFPD